MGLPQKNVRNLSPLLRSAGAFVLLVYVAAQTLCFLHCNFGRGLCDSGQSSCVSTGSTEGCHTESKSSSPCAPSQTATCVTLKNALFDGNTSPLIIPQFSDIYLLPRCALALDATTVKPGTIVLRHTKHTEWVLTPEVCLGPALRSLAPPSPA